MTASFFHFTIARKLKIMPGGGRKINSKDSAPRSRRKMTATERKIKAKRRARESQDQKKNFLQMMVQRKDDLTPAVANETNREESKINETLIDEINNEESMQNIEENSNNLALEMDGYVEEIYETDDDSDSTEPEYFEDNDEYIYKKCAKNLKERAQKEASNRCHVLEEKWALNYLKKMNGVFMQKMLNLFVENLMSLLEFMNIARMFMCGCRK